MFESSRNLKLNLNISHKIKMRTQHQNVLKATKEELGENL
jgi:hypothetical protein